MPAVDGTEEPRPEFITDEELDAAMPGIAAEHAELLDRLAAVNVKASRLQVGRHTEPGTPVVGQLWEDEHGVHRAWDGHTWVRLERTVTLTESQLAAAIAAAVMEATQVLAFVIVAPSPLGLQAGRGQVYVTGLGGRTFGAAADAQGHLDLMRSNGQDVAGEYRVCGLLEYR